MTIANTTGINAFDRRFYQAISDKAANYHREMYSGILEAFPVKQISFNQDEYKKPVFGESSGVSGGKPSANSAQMETELEHRVYHLKNVNAPLHWDDDDIMSLGPQLWEQNAEQIEEWARQANLSLFKGVYTGGFDSANVGIGTVINEGFLTNVAANTVAARTATLVEDLDGTDSALAAAGDVYKALTKFVESIPFRYIDTDGAVNLLMDPLFFSKANSTLFTNDSGVTEWEQFLRFYMKETSPYKIGKIYFSNDLALVGGTDTVGTNSRLMGWVSKPSVVERVYSRGFAKMGPDVRNVVNGISQMWTVKEVGAVHLPDAVIYSESITW